MKTALIGAFGLAAFGLLAASANDVNGNRSPRLISLAHELQLGNRPALASFWKEMEGGTPLLESIDGVQRQRRVTFVWRASNGTTRVTMMGGLPGANFLKPMTRLADTDLWYLTETHATEGRFQYAFQVNGPEELAMEEGAISREMPVKVWLLNFSFILRPAGTAGSLWIQGCGGASGNSTYDQPAYIRGFSGSDRGGFRSLNTL